MTDGELRADADEVTRLLELRGARREGGELRFTCPKPEHHAHGDAHPSARWHPEKGVWRCDVSGEGGGTLNLRWLLHMEARDHRYGTERAVASAPSLRAERRQSAREVSAQRETARWTIRDAQRKAIAVHVRLEPGSHGTPKDCVWFHPDGRTHGLPGDLKACDLPLYGSEELAQRPGVLVVLVEGEKARDALAAREILAVATVTGAAGTPRDEVLRVFEGRDVVVWPDADGPGRRHMQRIAARLTVLGIPYRLVDPWPDVTDGRDAADFAGTAEELHTLLATTPEPTTAERAGRRAEANSADSAEECWPDPLPLDAIGVPPFPLDALPAALADVVRDVARLTQTPPDLAGTMVLGVVGTVASRRVDVAIGRTHVEPMNLYAAVVSDSGTRKGPALRAVLAPLYALQSTLRREAEPTIRQLTERRKLAEKRLERLRDQAAKAAAAAEREQLGTEAETLAAELPTVPVLPTLVVSDRTTEKLELDIAQQGGALCLASEEAGTLFAIAGGRYSHDGAAQLDLFLKAYDRGEIDTARMTRDAAQCATPELSILVTPQPFLLRQLREHPEFHHRGLLPRFLFSLPPSSVGTRSYDPHATPDTQARATYAHLVNRLHEGFPKRADGEELPHLQIDGDALAVWIAYGDRVEADLRDGGRLAPIREWGSKQPGRVARLAGTLHVVTLAATGRLTSAFPEDKGSVDLAVVAARSIPPQTVAAACRLGEYFEAHALAAYDAMAALPHLEGARRVLGWIRRTGKSTLSAREAFTALDRNRFPTMNELTPCLALLVEHGYLCPGKPTAASGPGRRPSPVYEVHPGIPQGAPQYPQKPDSDSVNGHCADTAEGFVGSGESRDGAAAASTPETAAGFVRTDREAFEV